MPKKISLTEFENILSNTVFRKWHQESEERMEQEKYENRCRERGEYPRPCQYPRRTKKQWLTKLRSLLAPKAFSKVEKAAERKRRKALKDLLAHLGP